MSKTCRGWRTKIVDSCYNCRALGLEPEGVWLGGGKCSNPCDPRNQPAAVATWLRKEELKRIGRESREESYQRRRARYELPLPPPRRNWVPKEQQNPPPWRRASQEEVESLKDECLEEEEAKHNSTQSSDTPRDLLTALSRKAVAEDNSAQSSDTPQDPLAALSRKAVAEGKKRTWI